MGMLGAGAMEGGGALDGCKAPPVLIFNQGRNAGELQRYLLRVRQRKAPRHPPLPFSSGGQREILPAAAVLRRRSPFLRLGLGPEGRGLPFAEYKETSAAPRRVSMESPSWG